jgi:hypothetical protein
MYKKLNKLSKENDHLIRKITSSAVYTEPFKPSRENKKMRKHSLKLQQEYNNLQSEYILLLYDQLIRIVSNK